MFEPRGHDMMSGSILYPPHDPQNDFAVLFIETSGCLPMCGHGTIGTITIAIEEGLITPKIPGQIRMEAPAGLVNIQYSMLNDQCSSVKLTNVPAYLDKEGITADCPELGELVIDVAYGGNFSVHPRWHKSFRRRQHQSPTHPIQDNRQLFLLYPDMQGHW